MNKANLKSYAPQARKDFIAAVTARANQLGLSFKAGSLEVAPAQTQGDVTVISGQAWPSKVSGQRDKLIERIRKDGFEQTMEAVAYTWFNRFAALRYMELHDYLGHGHRALSSTAGGLPDILTHATDLSNDLPGLNPAKVTELKLAGNRDGELYRMLLVAQCNALSRAMPFLFERIDDDSELLLPDNLLRSDSVIAKLVEAISEEDWEEVEIIGWLYQFYISEKKDQVIGKVVKSEDIPAATQLFTPNWIVKYLVQNSVGRLWLMANPQSTLQKEWPYYITPAEQPPEVQIQLDALIQTRVREDGDTLNPESITVLDPACGSGHILVVAYDVLKAIYLERGYQPRAIPRLILEKNLYGLDIDDRAAQMAGFALLMKARADDRRLFIATDDAGNLQPPKLNVLSLQESKGLRAEELAIHLAPFKVQRATITALVETFEHAKTFGSLIQIPYPLKTHLALLPEILTLVQEQGDMYASAAATDLLLLVQQAQVLAMQFDGVVANPPYMGRKHMNSLVKDFTKSNYPSSKADLFSCFIERSYTLSKASGLSSMVTMQSWMFLSSLQEMRESLLNNKTLFTMTQVGYNSFPELNSKVAQATIFSLFNSKVNSFVSSFLDLNSADPAADKQGVFLERNPKNHYEISTDEFKKIPGCPIAYWSTDAARNVFKIAPPLSTICEPKQGLATTENAKYVRLWSELDIRSIGFGIPSLKSAEASGKKWFPYNKGGEFRKWYGNQDFVVNWKNNGAEIKADILRKYPYLKTPDFVAKNTDSYFRPSVSWSFISWSFGVRVYPAGFVFDVAGSSLFADTKTLNALAALLCSKVSEVLLAYMNPTLNFQVGNIACIPVLLPANTEVISMQCQEIAKSDWNLFESSFDFDRPYFLDKSLNSFESIELTYKSWIDQNKNKVNKMKQLEEDNNRIFIECYGLENDLSPDISLKQITLTINPFHRYSGDLTEMEIWERFCTDTTQELISYAIGCMMGRYSLDEPGLIYAHAGNIGFEPNRYATFPADADGIIPITDELWFADDAPSRVREFLRAVWGPDTLEENMAWLAESLGTKASETPDETIRRYVADKFFKDHLQTYKKRPIYWLFSSGKQGAFQALVYLHRYSEGTLARLRAEYVVPLIGKIQSRIEMLQKDAAAASSTAARNKLAKEVEKLKKKHVELLAYDEQLRHYADMRITLDLDDGVKVNYGKFGHLLADVKAITGGAGDD
jgi:hypothetical protein